MCGSSCACDITNAFLQSGPLGVASQVPESPLLQLLWHRLIIDEAQMVGSGLSQVRGAVWSAIDCDHMMRAHTSFCSTDPLICSCCALLRIRSGGSDGRSDLGGSPVVRHRHPHRGGGPGRRVGPAAHAEVWGVNWCGSITVIDQQGKVGVASLDNLPISLYVDAGRIRLTTTPPSSRSSSARSSLRRPPSDRALRSGGCSRCVL